MKIHTRATYSIAFYALACVLIYVAKPRMLFKEDGSLRRIGTNEDESMLASIVFIAFLAIVSFYLFVAIEVATGR